MYQTGGSGPKKPDKGRPPRDEIKPIARNHDAFRDYEILESMEAGIVLTGTEVKSLRAGKCGMKDSHARLEKGELWLYNLHIPPYAQGNIYNHDPVRKRKLLLHRQQVLRFFGRMSQKGLTMVPIKVYFKHGLVKCEVALAKTKKIFDRRDDIKKQSLKREIDRAIKNRNRRNE